MRRSRSSSALQWISLAVALAACSSSTTAPTQDAGVDLPMVTDRGTDLGAADRPSPDVPIAMDVVDVPSPMDVVDVVDVTDARDVVDVTDVVDTTDATDVVDAGRCDPATGCRAFWCGCGRCDPSTITCVPDDRACPLACASACPELDTAVCGCNGGTCSAPTFPPADAGADGGADAGGLPAGELCSSDAACAPGLLCCYPCGIPGCMNRCGAPDPRTGRCPLLP